VVLRRDQPLLSIKEKLVPQGCTKDATAGNANLKQLDAAGVTAALLVMHANTAELGYYKSAENDGIIAVGDITPQPPYAPLFINDTNDNKITGSDGTGSDNNSESNDMTR
jgi:hypothetical protein